MSTVTMRPERMRVTFLWLGALAAAVLLVLAACAKEPAAPAMAPKPPDPCRDQLVLSAPTCDGDMHDAEERKLIEMVNAHRAANGLPAVAASPSLALVANRHVRDLIQNVHKLSNSWSDCPYTAGAIQTYPCMWTAPKRLNTGYPGQGFEIAHSFSTGATAQTAFDSWTGNQRQNDMLLESGPFNDSRWQAIGVAIQGDYALLWLGKEPDPKAN